MSGMEPLAALGLACNIMQLLSFGGEAISLCRKVYKTGEIDPSLKDYSSQTAKICENLNDTLTQRQLNLGPDALALQQRATMCKAAADRLNHELELLTPAAGPGGWRRGFIAPIKAIRHKHHLSELEKDLNSLKSGLDTQLLVRIFDLVDPAKLKTEILVESKDSWRQHYSRPSTEYGLASDDNPQQAYPESHPRSWPCFTTWLQSERPSIYWICGKPGSGKSTLMKFIASDESPTRDSLKQWQSGVQILSHYFWLAGSPMQNNIKGFLCSLVYQVLSQDPSLALTLLETKPAIARKSSAMDWDQTELRRILINLAHQPVKAFCIFIDGLDELSSEESPRDLIDIIKEVQSPQVKVCLSSRPEPAMKMYLGHYPTLPMHVFIRDDIRNYAEGILNRAMSHRNGAFEIDRLVDNILSEADGVFLWVVLVTRSLERGIEKGDSLQILEERLRQMPKSLSELYSSMWQRREDDPETYQKGFSEFMNLMILAEDMLYLTHHKKVTVFELMAATNTSFLDKYLNQDDQVSGEELELLCRGTRNSIEAWSAGLLMVTNTPDTDSDADSEDMSLRMTENDGDSGTYYDLDDLEFYANMTVGFVHRTARDFLLDEVEGQKLWKRVDVSREDLEAKLMKAVLMRCQLWEFEDSVGFIDDFFDSMQPYEEAAYVPQSTLPDIEKAFYNGFAWRFGGKHLDRHQLRIDFLEAAADYGFRGYVFKQIQEMQQTGQLKAQDYASLLRVKGLEKTGQSSWDNSQFL
ncbi:hypothetical protein LRP88_12838 [Fusarium phalaenopsidis]